MPRFSIKSLLIATAVIAGGFYLAFVRPTVLAQRFVDAVNNNKVEYVRQAIPKSSELYRFLESKRSTYFRGDAELLPREWSDLWRLRRRVTVTYQWDYFELEAGVIGVNETFSGFIHMTPAM